MKFALPLLSLASAAQALYFFIDGATPKCFFEELPKDTLVVGHYVAEEHDDRINAWQQHNDINVYISVDVRTYFQLPLPSYPLSMAFFIAKTYALITISSTGSLRQRPPHRLPARHLLRPLHLHSPPIRRTQNLLRPLLHQRPHRMATLPPPQRGHQDEARPRDWRVRHY